MFAVKTWEIVVLCLKADSMHFAPMEKRTVGVSWRQIKADDRSNPEPFPPLQCLPQFSLHFCQCVEKAG